MLMWEKGDVREEEGTHVLIFLIKMWERGSTIPK
jgi:hypothetical protein